MRPVDFRNPDDVWYQLQRFKKGFLPAMQDAIPPAVASFLSYLPEKKPRVLVLTREPGSFQRDYLPQITQMLNELGNPREMQVSEFNVEKIVKAQASKPASVAAAHSLPFKNDYFDFIFGQSVLHCGKVDLWAREITRVMKSNSCFFHVQDDAPNPHLLDRSWREPVRVFSAMSEAEHASNTALQAHSMLVSTANRHFDSLKVSNASFTLEGNTSVDSSHKFELFGEHDLNKNNFLDFKLGITAFGTDRKIPKGNKQLKYTAIAFVATEAPIMLMLHYAMVKMNELVKK